MLSVLTVMIKIELVKKNVISERRRSYFHKLFYENHIGKYEIESNG